MESNKTPQSITLYIREWSGSLWAAAKCHQDSINNFVSIWRKGEPRYFSCCKNRLFLRLSSARIRVRICKPFKEPRNRFPAWRLGSLNVYKFGLWKLFTNPAHLWLFELGNNLLESVISWHIYMSTVMLKGTQEWEFFWLRLWNLYFFVDS